MKKYTRLGDKNGTLEWDLSGDFVWYATYSGDTTAVTTNDPVYQLAHLFDNWKKTPEDWERWQEIIDEPYG